VSKIVVFGSTSGIAEAYLRLVAKNGVSLILVARDGSKLDIQSADLKARGAKSVQTFTMDFSNFDSHGNVVKRCFESGPVDLVLIAQGAAAPQAEMETDFNKTMECFEINLLSLVSICNQLIPYFEKQKYGQIAGISSPAGDRGRQTNFIYGASKAGVQVYLAGLRGRLFGFGVNVLDIRPGFVSTRMTASMKQGPLFASPDAVAKGINRAIMRRKSVVYLPWFWCGIMLIIRNIPELIFKRLKI
jgi:short-subunit dehydrogenase